MMGQKSCFLQWMRCVLLVALFAWGYSNAGFSAQELPSMDTVKIRNRETSVQVEKTQWFLISQRGAELQHKTRVIANAVLVMFLFGAFCAIWAQNSGRRVLWWFLAGFVFTIFAVLVILRINPRPRRRGRKKRYHRRVMDYLGVAHY